MFYDELAEEVEFCSRATQSRAVEEAWADGTIYCIQIMHYGTHLLSYFTVATYLDLDVLQQSMIQKKSWLWLTVLAFSKTEILTKRQPTAYNITPVPFL